MSRVVDHLAELTGFRDRDALDTTLVGALKDLLGPVDVAIYRSVGVTGNERWLMRARLAPGDVAATADPVWADLETLPPLAAFPHRHQCLLTQQAVRVAGVPELVCFALTSDLQTSGVLEIKTGAPLRPAGLRLVRGILRLYCNLQGLLDYSERDTLTGLLNRKTFDESFLRVAAEHAAVDAAGPAVDFAAGPAGEQRRPVREGSTWLAVIDIDHFKRVNDEHGHLIGDEVLLLLARVMRTGFRYHDLLYRFGGEEFVVMMRCTGSDAAMLALERMRASVAQYPFPQVGRITVSVGFTELRPEDPPTAAFERADKAVYHVKQNGRNLVAGYETLVAEGRLVDSARAGVVELF